MKTGIKQLNIN